MERTMENGQWKLNGKGTIINVNRTSLGSPRLIKDKLNNRPVSGVVLGHINKGIKQPLQKQ